ncbi:hypothetical protein P691DRAFT_772036 [Macrolepiota fuliginosa MF-IS2]|uniref:CUE domain-containing protein n=1 Tax=Macrolepiota fuliginosa MF-IS2 TaxID=1400762 RepID=A0A9P5XJT1_9AGAR|nr:hypothetical protein P691DRAFT_772036 [Macrolepiota fuliginosa MF-IS2]
MEDKEPPTTAIEPVATATLTSTSVEDRARSTSASPPPPIPTASKPSALAGQSTITSRLSSSSPTPEPPPRPVTNLSTREAPLNPQIAALKAIFPDYDDVILQSVLDSVDGDQDRAIDLLLGMSDPDFRSEAPPAVQQPPMTQEELDEQLARRLMLEEQQQAQQWQMQQQQRRPHRRSPRSQSGEQPQQQTSSPPVGQGERDAMTEFQESFTRIAETGKKTFGAFVSKVKAKIQEFEKPNPDASGSGVQPTWGNTGTASYYDPNATQSPSQPGYQPYHGHHPGTAPSGPPMSTPANTAISQPAAFYDPNPSPQPLSPPTQYASPNLSEKKQSIALEGYDVTPLPSASGTAASASGSASVPQPAQPPTAAANSGGFNATGPPRGPSLANPIDGGKLGLLPKRPISLVRDPPQTQSQPAERQHSDDDDDLEYAESPFDNDRK